MKSIDEGDGDKRIYFCSGHRDITPEEFTLHYVPQFKEAFKYTNAKYVIGDYRGADSMCLEYLWKKGISLSNITVYHMFTSPRISATGVNTVGGFQTDIERDSTMTRVSTSDILWIRPGKDGSGTDQNYQRRMSYNDSK